MTPEQKAAFIMAQTASALAELMGMRAENATAFYRGEDVYYNKDAFTKVIVDHGITHNQVIEFFRE